MMAMNRFPRIGRVSGTRRQRHPGRSRHTPLAMLIERLEGRAMLAVNVPPVVTVPGPQATVADTPLAFTTYRQNLISVADPDASANQVTVKLSVDTGVISLFNPDPGGGLTYSIGDGTEDTAMEFIGTVDDINTALQWVSYQPPGYVPERGAMWSESNGGNGHWYELVSTSVSWEEANAEAQARGGYLATITSAEENAYVMGLAPANGMGATRTSRLSGCLICG